MKPYPSYKDSGVEWICEIPKEWDKCKLKHYCEVKDGTHDTPQYIDGDGVPLVTQKDITEGKLNFSKTKNISWEDYENINIRSNVEKGDVIMSMIGSIGNPTIVDVDRPFSIKNVCLFKTSNSEESTKFINYQLSSDLLTTELEYHSRGGVQGFVSLDVLRNLLFIKPPLLEQQQISNYLDQKTKQIDELIEKTKQKVELLKEKRTSIINHCVTKGLDPNAEMKDSGVKWVGEIPMEWVVSKLKYESIESVQYGINISSDEYVEEGIRFIRTKDIDDDGNLIGTGVFLNKSNVEETYITQKYDFLISRSGTLGRTYLHFSDSEMTYGGYLVRFNFKSLHLSKIVFFYSKSSNFEDWMKLNTIVSTIGNINGGKYSNMVIPIPPLLEQQQIVTHLDKETQKIDTLIEKEKQRIDLLKEYRQSLISEVVTGKIDVRDEVLQ